MSSNIDYFSSESLRQGLKGKTVRGGVVTGVAQGVQTGIALATIPVLSRLLQPEDFGLLQLVVVFTGLAGMFVDAGLSMATVQRAEITRQQVTNLFWIASGLGLVVTLVVAALSPAIAWFYGEPRLMPITLALACSYLISGLSIQHQALLRRGMQFGRLAVTGVTSQVVAQAVGIAYAWRNYQQPHDYWALVLIPITAAATNAALLWLACRWSPGLPRRGAGTRQMVEFGMNLTGFSFVNYFTRNFDRLMLGKIWGEAVVGGYAQAYKIFLFPMQRLNGAIAPVVTPALSRLNDSPDAYRRAYRAVLEKLLLITMPLSAFVCVNAQAVTAFLLGDQWIEYAPVLQWLALAGTGQAITNTTGWLYQSQGRGADLLRWGLVGNSIHCAAIAASVAWGPVILARNYALVSLFVVVPACLWWVGRRGPVSSADICKAAFVPAGITLLVFAASAGVLTYDVGSPALTIAVGGGVCALVWACATGLWFFRRSL